MRFIYASYNMLHNYIDVTTFDGYILRIDCGKAEEGLKTTPCSECALNALAIDNPLEYTTLYLEGGMQTWVDAEDSLELWQYIFLCIKDWSKYKQVLSLLVKLPSLASYMNEVLR